MKVKIFSYRGSIIELEKNINDFIVDKEVIDIKMSESAADDEWSTTILIMYHI